MAAEPLSSNVVNYLVWRYLQEAGYARSALYLSRQWNPEPDSLPFAKNVKPRMLVNMLQDGMSFDKLLAVKMKTEPNYYFGSDHGRPYSDRDGNLLTLDQGVPAHLLAEEAGPVPEPPPKKGKGKKKAAKTNGVVAPIAPPEPHVNGDAMDIDQNGHTHVTNSVRADSEIVPSDNESPSVADLPLSTLSLGQSTAVQTEGPKQLAKNTLFGCSVKDAGKKVRLTSWGPPKAPLLLTGGENILRIHLIGNETENLTSSGALRHLDLSPMPDDYQITADCWSPAGELIVSVEERKKNERGDVLKLHRVYKFADDCQQYRLLTSSAGKVHRLCWNAAKHLLLSLSFDSRNCSIRIFRDVDPNDLDSKYPIWDTAMPIMLLDARWISDSAFVVCGEKFFGTYQMEENNNFTCLRQLETNITWEQLEYDASSGICAARGRSGSALDFQMEQQKFYLGIVHPSSPKILQVEEYPDALFSHLDFRPAAQTNGYDTFPDSKSPVLLATAAEGAVRVWDVNASNPFTCVKQLTMPDGSTALNIAFSPNGRLLAAAGFHMLAMWDTRDGGSWQDYKGKDKSPEPTAIWRAKDCTEEAWESDAVGDFSIGWASDSKCVSIALGNQIAIIPISV